MLQDLSVVLYILGIAALFWIPVYFLFSCKKKNRNICTGIIMYYWLMILSTFVGNFPVPFMGYGISPILGFTIFLIWFIHDEKESFRSLWPTIAMIKTYHWKWEKGYRIIGVKQKFLISGGRTKIDNIRLKIYRLRER